MNRLGEGGMGTVYAAYDDRLDRKIAIKLLRTSRLDSAEARERTLREARALARLSHPNVVHVYEVGELDDQLFVAMEFLAGPTLRSWLDSVEPRGWKQCLEIWLQAGRGLAAAHAQGIIHRDFKPHNAMFGADGRVRVLDFGLASLGEHEPLGDGDSPDPSKPIEAQITRTGVVLGTPAYMAPEQFAGRRADARTDQFGFCVALYEALYGERPFEGRTYSDLRRAVESGKIRPAQAGTSVPAWVRKVVLRGLANDPDQRWPSMAALLDALGSGRRRATLQRTLSGTAGLALAAAGTLAYGYWDEARREANCELAGARIDEVWNDERRAAVEQAIVATQVLDAEPTAAKVLALIDRQAQSWRRARTEVCMDVEVRESWDDSLEDRAQWCLEQRWDDLEILIAGLTDPDVLAVQRAIEVAYKGVIAEDAVDPCVDEARLALYPLPPSREREPIRAVRAELARADLLGRSGKYAAGLEVAKQALTQAEALGWVPLTASARYQVGSLSSYVGDIEAALASLTDAYFEAAQIGNGQQSAMSAALLVYVLTEDLYRLSDARHWGRLAELELLRMGAGEDGLVRASYHQYVGNLEMREGNFERAKAEVGQALALRREILGPEHPNAILTVGALAVVHYMAKEYDQAAALYEQQVTLAERTLGPEHPKFAAILDQYALTLMETDRLEQSETVLRRSLAILERSVGPNHITVANALMNLGIVEMKLGRWEEGRTMLERAEQVIHESHGPESQQMGVLLGNIAKAQRRTGQLAQARSSYERSIAIKRDAAASEPTIVADLLAELAELALEQGLPTEAIEFAEQSLTQYEGTEAPAESLAFARFILARARWTIADQRGDVDAREQALADARAALQTPRTRTERTEHWTAADAWLASRSE
ncbi:MAG TPA: serine/threonine-protein kinase [Enhygromyxa sp.]|nr:serine/threonine-protein kinase [Enhygromyxa sp.]